MPDPTRFKTNNQAVPEASPFEDTEIDTTPESSEPLSYTSISKKYNLSKEQMYDLMCNITSSNKTELEALIKDAITTHPEIKSFKSAITHIMLKYDSWKIDNYAVAMANPESIEPDKPRLSAADIKFKLKQRNLTSNKDNEQAPQKPSLPQSIKEQMYEEGRCIQCGYIRQIDIRTQICLECEADARLKASEPYISNVAKDVVKEPVKNQKESRFKRIPVQVQEKANTPPDTEDPNLEIPIVAIFNGSAGSGKTKALTDFENIFIVDLENKFAELKRFTLDPKIKAMSVGPIEKLGLVNVIEALAYNPETHKEDLEQTWENLVKCIEWFKEFGYKQYAGIAIDVGVMIRESKIAVVEKQLHRDLTQYDYRYVTKDTKPLIKNLILFCKREFKRHCIIVTHWGPEYETFINAYGYKESRIKQWVPDVKEWMRDIVTWRIDFLKPEESGFSEKFIIYFDKAPVFQYKQLDLTNKNIFQILSEPQSLEKEIRQFDIMVKENRLAEKKGGSK